MRLEANMGQMSSMVLSGIDRCDTGEGSCKVGASVKRQWGERGMAVNQVWVLVLIPCAGLVCYCCSVLSMYMALKRVSFIGRFKGLLYSKASNLYVCTALPACKVHKQYFRAKLCYFLDTSICDTV